MKQPLSVLYLGKSLETVSAYASVICDELNIKEIVYLSDFDSLSHEYAALNFQVAGRQLKGDLNKVKAICDNLTISEQESLMSALKKEQPVQLAGYDNSIAADCFTLFKKDKENVARSAGGIPVAINTEITPALKAEGVYRELLRHCQLLRREAGFSVSDRVTLFFETESEMIRSVINNYSNDIARETLSEIQNISQPVMRKKVDLDDGIINISIV